MKNLILGCLLALMFILVGDSPGVLGQALKNPITRGHHCPPCWRR